MGMNSIYSLGSGSGSGLGLGFGHSLALGFSLDHVKFGNSMG